MGKLIDQIMTEILLAIDNALTNPIILAALEKFGYGETKLREGKALYDAAEVLINKQAKEYGDKAGASQAMEQAKDALRVVYVPHVQIARIAFKANAAAYQLLELRGERKRSHSSFLRQAGAFYDNMMSDEGYKTEMAKFGITAETLTAAQALVAAAAAALKTYTKEAGEAQQATEARDEAIDKLEEWKGDYFAILRIALAEDPQLLEVLGIVVKS